MITKVATEKTEELHDMVLASTDLAEVVHQFYRLENFVWNKRCPPEASQVPEFCTDQYIV